MRPETDNHASPTAPLPKMSGECTVEWELTSLWLPLDRERHGHRRWSPPLEGLASTRAVGNFTIFRHATGTSGSSARTGRLERGLTRRNVLKSHPTAYVILSKCYGSPRLSE